MSEEKKKDSWQTRKKPILENLDETISLKEKALKNAFGLKTNINRSVDILRNDLTRLGRIRVIFRSDSEMPINQVTANSIDLMNDLSSREKESAKNVFLVSERLKGESNIMAGTILTSNVVSITMGSTTAYIIQSVVGNEPIKFAANKINEETPNDRKDKLIQLVKKIDAGLATKLNSAWQTINDTTNEDRYSQAAHSARELISDILRLLTPDDKVKTMKWFKAETREGNPTHRQRAKYVIVGSNDLLNDEILKPIDDLSKNIRDSYEQLNPIAHLRDYSKDLQLRTESIIDNTQIYLLELLKLRDIYFKA